MKRLIFCALAILPLSANAQFSLSKPATAPKQSIEPTKFNLAASETPTSEDLMVGGADQLYKPGELIDLWIQPAPTPAAAVKYAWTILPQTKHIIWPDSTRLIFSAGNENQEYTIILTASIVTQTGEKIDQLLKTKVVNLKIGDTPANTPNVPELSSDLANQAYGWTKLITLSPDYTRTDLAQDSQALIINFQSIAAQIESGVLTDVSQIFDTTRELNKNSQINEQAWQPWFAELAKYLNASYEDGQLVTAESYAMAWKAIVEALQQVK